MRGASKQSDMGTAATSWQMIEVGRRLGLSGLFPRDENNHAGALWEEYRRGRKDPRTALPSTAELRATAGLQWPFVQGRETKWRYNTSYDTAADRTRGQFHFYGHA